MRNTGLIVALILVPFVTFSQVKEFGWLTGKWKLKGKSNFEVWKQNADQKTMEATSYRIKGRDTIVTETLKIKFENNAFHFIADVAGDQPPVYFRIKENNADSFISENQNHDFPKIIRYQLLTPTSYKAEIEGDGKTITYYYDKVE